MKEILKKLIPSFLINRYHFLLSFLGAIIFGFPSKRIKVIGVAGTDGKSTTVFLISKILEEAGYKVAFLSSIFFKIGKKQWLNTLKMTMPGRFVLQKFLKQAVDNKCAYAILEVTDEGIKQHRHKFIDFKIAVLTNITPEHIEVHGSFEKMRQANEKLFQITKKTHILNLDDENIEHFLKFPADKKYGYNLKPQISDFKTAAQNLESVGAENCQVLSRGLKFYVNQKEFSLKLLGEFNIYNSLAAICLGLSQDIDLETCKKALEKVEGIPGRMEEVIFKPFGVFVDYAVTPNALKQVYETINLKIKNQGSKLICVFGACGGGRDKWKRPILGKIAAEYCDEIILTNEDPYNEDPNRILSQIKSGIFNSRFPTPNFYEILDRREAIKKSLELAKPGDIVIITGKGCEPLMCLAGGKKIPWDDRQIVKEEFEKREEGLSSSTSRALTKGREEGLFSSTFKVK